MLIAVSASAYEVKDSPEITVVYDVLVYEDGTITTIESSQIRAVFTRQDIRDMSGIIIVSEFGNIMVIRTDKIWVICFDRQGYSEFVYRLKDKAE